VLHADDGLLHSYLDGALPAAERARLEAHLRECAECRAGLDAERALRARAATLLGGLAPPEREMPEYARLRPHKRRRWRVPAAWAASIAAAFATGWYLQEQRDVRRLGGNATEIAGTRSDAAEPARVAQAPRHAAPPPAPPARALEASPAPVLPPAPQQPVAGAVDAKVRAAPPRALAAADASLEQRDRTSNSTLDAAAAVALLGRAPAALVDRPILSMTRISSEDGGGVVIEQEVGAGAVIRLYEREVPANRDELAPMARAPASERLARYLGTLRVEIAGPLTADSLSKLLDLVR